MSIYHIKNIYQATAQQLECQHTTVTHEGLALELGRWWGVKTRHVAGVHSSLVTTYCDRYATAQLL